MLDRIEALCQSILAERVGDRDGWSSEEAYLEGKGWFEGRSLLAEEILKLLEDKGA